MGSRHPNKPNIALVFGKSPAPLNYQTTMNLKYSRPHGGRWALCAALLNLFSLGLPNIRTGLILPLFSLNRATMSQWLFLTWPFTFGELSALASLLIMLLIHVRRSMIKTGAVAWMSVLCRFSLGFGFMWAGFCGVWASAMLRTTAPILEIMVWEVSLIPLVVALAKNHPPLVGWLGNE